MIIPFPAALHMSYTVNAATDAAVSASISTPVRASGGVRAVADIRTDAEGGSRTRSTETDERGTEWQSGMSELVCFAARMPAVCARVKTSPFGELREVADGVVREAKTG